MDVIANGKRKRDIQYFERTKVLDGSLNAGGCGLSLLLSSRKRKRSLQLEDRVKHSIFPDKESCDKMRSLNNSGNQNVFQREYKRNSFRRSLRRRVSISVMRQKMKRLQDYSLPSPTDNFRFLHNKNDSSKLNRRNSESKGDHEMQHKIDYEIKMREGTARLLAASKHPTQLLEAAKNLLTSNTRIIAYMAELQQRKSTQALTKTNDSEGSQIPCTAVVNMSDLRIPLMWKDTDHFKNKGDHRRYAVFCLVKIGTEIYDTSLITCVDRNMTDLSFDDVIAFDNIPHDFECVLEVYCNKLHEDLTMASTPKKIKKKMTGLSESVGRSVGKRLSGLHDSQIIGNMVLGPKFELVATGSLNLHNVDDVVRTFDLRLEEQQGVSCELPLFGHYCCRLSALPQCLVQPVVFGYLSLHEADSPKWKQYWCVLKNLQLSCWSSPDDVEVTTPLVTIPVTKNTLISEVDPRVTQMAHTFHIKTVSERFVTDCFLAADNKDQFTLWWDGLQQHLLDQAFWKQACDYIMDVQKVPSNKKSTILGRKTSIYDDTPLKEPSPLLDKLKVDDDKFSQMLNTIIGEAKEIHNGSIKSTSLSSSGSLQSTSSS